MKSLRIIAATALLIAASAQASEWRIFGVLGPEQEVPPNDSSAYGSAAGSFDDTTNVFTWLVQFYALGGGPAQLGHFHTGAVGEIGPAVIDFSGQIAGQFEGSANGFSVLSDGQAQLLLKNGFYANIHTPEFPNGEIRGQLAAALVPEAPTWGMSALGLLGLAAVLGRRRRRG